MNELQIDLERLREVCQRYGVVHLDVFGSVARGEADPDSDIDLLYVISPKRALGSASSILRTNSPRYLVARSISSPRSTYTPCCATM